jgi:hypothetical protein
MQPLKPHHCFRLGIYNRNVKSLCIYSRKAPSHMYFCRFRYFHMHAEILENEQIQNSSQKMRQPIKKTMAKATTKKDCTLISRSDMWSFFLASSLFTLVTSCLFNLHDAHVGTSNFEYNASFKKGD